MLKHISMDEISKIEFKKKKFKIAKVIATINKLYCGSGGNSPPHLSCLLAQKPDNCFYFIIFSFFLVVHIELRALFMLSK